MGNNGRRVSQLKQIGDTHAEPPPGALVTIMEPRDCLHQYRDTVADDVQTSLAELGH